VEASVGPLLLLLLLLLPHTSSKKDRHATAASSRSRSTYSTPWLPPVSSEAISPIETKACGNDNYDAAGHVTFTMPTCVTHSSTPRHTGTMASESAGSVGSEQHA
jgi:hypothetical protein